MTQWLVALLFALGTAFAQVPDAPSVSPGSRFTLTDTTGNVIGTGLVEGEGLTLNLVGDFSGFATLSISDASGEVLHYDATVSGDDEIVVVTDDDLIELREFLAASGIALSIAVDPSAVQDAGPAPRAGGDDDFDDDDFDDDDDDRDDDDLDDDRDDDDGDDDRDDDGLDDDDDRDDDLDDDDRDDDGLNEDDDGDDDGLDDDDDLGDDDGDDDDD